MENKNIDIMPYGDGEVDDSVLTALDVNSLYPSKIKFENSIQQADSSGYTSYKPKDFNDKLNLYRLAFDGADKLSSLIGKSITVKDIFIHTVNIKGIDVPRTVLITPDKKSYSCVSLGVYSSLTSLISAIGLPDTWEAPIEFNVTKEKTANGDLLKISVK